MLILAIIFLIAAIGWSVLTVFANGMSDNPSAGFVGGGSMLALWAISLGFFIAWMMGWHFTI